MSLIVDGITIPTSETIWYNGVKLERIIFDGVEVWKKSGGPDVFKDGVLDEGISVSGFVLDGSIYRSGCTSRGGTDSGGQKSDWKTPYISGIDFTNFSQITVRSESVSSNQYGVSIVRWGIDLFEDYDSYREVFFEMSTKWLTDNNIPGYGGVIGDRQGCTRIFTRTLDISAYSGIHALCFYQYARSDSDYANYVSKCDLGITDIIMS